MERMEKNSSNTDTKPRAPFAIDQRVRAINVGPNGEGLDGKVLLADGPGFWVVLDSTPETGPDKIKRSIWFNAKDLKAAS